MLLTPMRCFFLAACSLAASVSLCRGAEVEVSAYGAHADGTTLTTDALQKAIDACAAAGGGVVRIPAGRYLTGTIQLKSGVTLHLDKEAVLLGSTDASDYRNLDPFIDGSGNPMGYALIVAVDADKVGIKGPGTIDGQGPKIKAKQSPYTIRPFLVRWVRCSNITVKEATLTNPGAWTLNFFQASHAVVEGLTIRTRGLGLANNDGINIDSSEHMRISACDVDSGDDALVIKATSMKPSRDIVATDCKLSTHTNAIKLGTESIGGFEDISVSKCEVTKTDMAGIALYEVDGADLKHVTISDIRMDGVAVPISIRLGARLKTFRPGDTARPAPGRLTDVTIRNITARNVKHIGVLINGVPNHPVDSLTLEHIDLELPGGGTAAAAGVQLAEKENAYPEYNMFGTTFPAFGMYARHVQDLKMTDVKMHTLTPDARPEVVKIDVTEKSQ